MRFIVDESTGVAVATFLRAEGHEVVFVGEEMPQAVDEDIIRRAARENAILVTNDKDFGELSLEAGRGITAYCCCALTTKTQQTGCGC